MIIIKIPYEFFVWEKVLILRGCLGVCRRELLHSYGFEHMFTLNNLEKAGLLSKQVCYSNPGCFLHLSINGHS